MATGSSSASGCVKIFSGVCGAVADTVIIAKLVVEVFDRIGSKMKNGKGKRKPNTEPGPN